MKIIASIALVLKWFFIISSMLLGILMFFGPMFIGGDLRIQWPGAFLIIVAGAFCFRKLTFPKEQKETSLGPTDYLLASGFVIFLIGLGLFIFLGLDFGHRISDIGMIIFSIGMFVYIYKAFRPKKKENKVFKP